MVNSAPKILSWTGTLSVGSSRERVKELLEAFAASKTVFLSLTGLLEMDLSSIQIIYAAMIEAKEKQVQFELSGSVSGSLSETLLKGGFLRKPVSEGKDLLGALFLHSSLGGKK